jgi:hypothetical protein
MVAQDHGTVPGLATPELAHNHPVDLAPLGTAAANAVVTPTSHKAADATNVGSTAKTETRCVICEQPTDDGKRFATVRALPELKSIELHRAAAGDGPVRLYVTRWDLISERRNVAAVHAFAEQVRPAHA